MDVSDITPQVEELDEALGQVQDALEPLLGDIGDVSSKLPLLDKAKLYVLVSYAVESLLFCKARSSAWCTRALTSDAATLRLNGVDTREHAVLTELTRIKQYMEKIQKVETPPAERENTVNTEAAARFLKSDLVGHRSCQCSPDGLLTRHRVTTRTSKTS